MACYFIRPVIFSSFHAEVLNSDMNCANLGLCAVNMKVKASLSYIVHLKAS